MTTQPDLYRRCELCDAALPDDAASVACTTCDVDVFVCAKCAPRADRGYTCGFCARGTSLDEPEDVDLGDETYRATEELMVLDDGGEA